MRGRRTQRMVCCDRGATSADYLGTLVVIAALIGALSGTEIGSRVHGGLQIVLCRITGGNCSGGGAQAAAGAPHTDQDFEPRQCTTANSRNTAGAEVKIGWFRLGDEFGFQKQEYTTRYGKTRVSLTFTDSASVGAGAPKPGITVRTLGTGTVELAVGVRVTNGDTWVFDSPREAERFRVQLEELKTWEYSAKYGGAAGGNIYAMYEWEKKQDAVTRQLGRRHITFGRISLDGTGELALQKARVDERRLSSELGGRFRVAPEVTVMSNGTSEPPTKAYTYQFQVEYTAGATVRTGSATRKLEDAQTRTGTVTVTRYEDGSLARIDMTQSVEVKGSEGDTLTVGRSSEKANAGGSHTLRPVPSTSNSLTFPQGDPAKADRDIAEAWLDGNGHSPSPFSYLLGGPEPTRRPGADDRFGRLMFEKGMSSRTEHTGVVDARAYGFQVNLGLSVGASLSVESSHQRVRKAEFLGAPKADGTRRYLPYSYCAN